MCMYSSVDCDSSVSVSVCMHVRNSSSSSANILYVCTCACVDSRIYICLQVCMYVGVNMSVCTCVNMFEWKPGCEESHHCCDWRRSEHLMFVCMDVYVGVVNSGAGPEL